MPHGTTLSVPANRPTRMLNDIRNHHLINPSKVGRHAGPEQFAFAKPPDLIVLVNSTRIAADYGRSVEVAQVMVD